MGATMTKLLYIHMHRRANEWLDYRSRTDNAGRCETDFTPLPRTAHTVQPRSRQRGRPARQHDLRGRSIVAFSALPPRRRPVRSHRSHRPRAATAPKTVSYTHLDVYKRQLVTVCVFTPVAALAKFLGGARSHGGAPPNQRVYLLSPNTKIRALSM